MRRFIVSRSFARSFVTTLLLFAACCSSGCIFTFERDWKAAHRCGIPCDQLAGLWEGTWRSDSNGHHGRLRAIITRCDDGRYHVRYHATFAAIIPYAYDTTHTVTATDGATHFHGEEDLGFLAGGYYCTDGQADGQTFCATYTADKDYGTFQMCRVGPCTGYVAGCAALPTSANPVLKIKTEPAAPH